ncbi:hypothetical protein C2S53_011763 [Perilla frutescens var. hirtella]|uniref:F-box domain-containing protein n=1 Tax=Perilla frutescens var. hirtella TaxID=608512 RepID=A0AAD4P6Y7_PERFH|nr:hypothetical protein C2S53_011763 [Perilla frutescens var. hirtella]
MTRFPKKNKVSTLETIPYELVTEILSRVAASSVVDIFNVKLSSKKLKQVAEDGHVYQHACLDKIPIVQWKPLSEKQRIFLKNCRESFNPELLYREALVDFFDNTKFQSAYLKLDKASKLGHIGALYVTCVILLFSNDDKLKRKGIKLIGDMKKAKSLKGKLRFCRKKLFEELKCMWVKNPNLKEQPEKHCTTHEFKRNPCSKNIKEVAEDAHVYHHACLDTFPIVQWKPLSEEQQIFLKKYRESSNPELLYREAPSNRENIIRHTNLKKIRGQMKMKTHTNVKLVLPIKKLDLSLVDTIEY